MMMIVGKNKLRQVLCFSISLVSCMMVAPTPVSALLHAVVVKAEHLQTLSGWCYMWLSGPKLVVRFILA